MSVIAAPPVPKTKKTATSEEPALAAIRAERERVARALVSVLRGARQDADLTQKQMALGLGYSEDVVSNIEALRTPISYQDAILWATTSNLDIAEFFERSLFALQRRTSRRR